MSVCFFVCSAAFLPYKSTVLLMMSVPPLWCVYFKRFSSAWPSLVAPDIRAIRAVTVLILVVCLDEWDMYMYKCTFIGVAVINEHNEENSIL